MHSISVKDLTLTFGALDVLKTLNLDVAEGEFIVLLGPSGCGKSTLLNCIAGLLDISDGQIWIKGRNVTITAESKMQLDCAQLAAKATATASLEGATVDMSDLKNEFYKDLAKVKDMLYTQVVSEDKFFPTNPEKVRNYHLAGGVAISTLPPMWLIAVGLFVGAVVELVRARRLGFV